jgi:hypothetical protein
MNAVDTELKATNSGEDAPIQVPFFIRGEVVYGDAMRHVSRDLGVEFATPEISLDALVMPRTQLPPLLDVPLKEIIDFLVELGERVDPATNPHMAEALEHTSRVNALPRRVIENLYRGAKRFASREMLEAQVAANFPDPAVLDGWVERTDALGSTGKLRAFPPRMIHMLAGNAPSSVLHSIAQGALVKAVSLFKMPSSDMFTGVAMLRTMADIDATHPVVKSMSAVYWKGGDERIERALYRPQYFDKIAAWGGGPAIANVIQYLGPGLQLISFDPKTSISMIGREGFEDDAVIDDIAEAAAADATVFNQDACLASRFIFAEGDRAGIEQFCETLAGRMAVDRHSASAKAPPPSAEIRDEVEMLSLMEDGQFWGTFDGSGLVVLTDEPVGFHPDNKTVNVVHVAALADAVRFANVATQTVGVYPYDRKAELRDGLASMGAQRVVQLGKASSIVLGGPHDAMFPLQRFVHWMADEDPVTPPMY